MTKKIMSLTKIWIESIQHCSNDHLLNLFIDLIRSGSSKPKIVALRKLIESRMHPSDQNILEIVPGVGGKPFETTLPAFNPEEDLPSGRGLDDFMQGVQRDSEKTREQQQELADALQDVYRKNHPNSVVCPECGHQMIPDHGPLASCPSSGYYCVNCTTKTIAAGQ